MLKELLHKKMRENKLSTREVANMAGTSHTTIVRILQGKEVDLDTLLKLGNWLNVKPSALLNSMARSTDGYSEKIAVLLKNNPLLAKEFKKAIEAIEEGRVAPSIIEDITSYAAYKINLYNKST